MLTFIIEKITKATYADQLQKRICTKAMLSNTREGSKIQPLHNEAHSYNFESGKWIRSTETDRSIPRGAGNIISTSRDLCLFITALFSGKLISVPMLEKMMSMKQGYGYGLVQYPFGNKKLYGHTGGIDGFQSMLAYNREDSVAMCILGNGLDYSINDMAIALLSAQFGEPFDIPSFEKRVLEASSLKTPEGVYGNSKIGMKISIFNRDGQLMAQATGQSAFLLTPVSGLEYQYEAAGIRIIFLKENDEIREFKLYQGGMDLLFSKE